MNKTLITLAATAGVILTGPAFAADEKMSSETKTTTKIEKDDDGSYKEKRTATEEMKDAAGTKTSSETTVKVEADEEGNTEKTVKTEKVEDPKGLFNKQKTVTKDEVKYKDGEVETKHEKKVNGKTVEESSQTTKPKY